MADEPFGAFLRSRRARLDPAAAGLPSAGHRRVPGLRREELAALAGVSVDYVIRLEQGRVLPSPEVATALARALQLDVAEREHLLALARPWRPPAAPPGADTVGPGVWLLLERLDPLPAYVVGPWLDVLAANRVGTRLLLGVDRRPDGERNLARLLFGDEAWGRMLGRDGAAAADMASTLRLACTRYPDQAAPRELVAGLLGASPSFRALWQRQDVHAKARGTKRFHHPEVGVLELEVEALGVLGAPGQTLMTYRAEPGSPSATGLRRLAREAALAPA
jgi:transcriptional regulator with XRE-family HTH domain